MTWLIRILTVVASLCLMIGLWIPAKAWVAQQMLERAWAETSAGMGREKPWPWADTWPVARLTLPTLSESFVVLEGVSGQSLAFGPGHLAASAAPGKPGTVVIAGHRDTVFRELGKLKPGDPIRLAPPLKAPVVYRVVRARVVDSRKRELQLDSRNAGAPDRLLLITCYPFDAVRPGGPLRYVVEARRVASVACPAPCASVAPEPASDGGI